MGPHQSRMWTDGSFLGCVGKQDLSRPSRGMSLRWGESERNLGSEAGKLRPASLGLQTLNDGPPWRTELRALPHLHPFIQGLSQVCSMSPRACVLHRELRALGMQYVIPTWRAPLGPPCTMASSDATYTLTGHWASSILASSRSSSLCAVTCADCDLGDI